MRLVLSTFLLLFLGGSVSAQIIRAGVKAGYQLSWARHDDKDYRREVKANPVHGFNAGGVLSFKVKDRYFLHTEYLFSTKGKRVKSRDKLEELDDKITYYYIDVPLLYNIHFKSKLKGDRQFTWYAGAGPLFSYWLGGKGTVYNTEFAENEAPPLDYTLAWGERGEDFIDPVQVYVKDARRFQLGFNVGGGILLEPESGHKFMFDLRMEIGHTWLGKPESADYVIPVTYDDNLKARNMGLRFSVMYLLESNLDRKIRNKGKSTKNKKRL